jgi:hypothetical protein
MDINRKDLDDDQVALAKHDLVSNYPQTFNYYNYDKCFPNAGYVAISSIVDTGGHVMAVVNAAGDTYEEVVRKSKHVIKSINSSIPMNITKMGQWFPVSVQSANMPNVKRHVVSNTLINQPNALFKYKTEDVEASILHEDVNYLLSDEKTIDDVKLTAKKNAEIMKMKLKTNERNDDDDPNSICTDITKLNNLHIQITELSKTLVNYSKRMKILGAMVKEKYEKNPNWYEHYTQTYLKYNYSHKDILTLDELQKIIDYSLAPDHKLTLDVTINVALTLPELNQQLTSLTLETL